MEDHLLPAEWKSAFSTVVYPLPVHLPMMTWVPVILMATMCLGALLESLLWSWTLMLLMPSVGAMASQMHWTMVLTCGYHVVVLSRLGQYPVVTTSCGRSLEGVQQYFCNFLGLDDP